MAGETLPPAPACAPHGRTRHERHRRKYGSSWRIRYEVGLKPDGKRDQRSKAGFKTKREAHEARSEALERVRRGESFDARKITVGEFLDSWVTAKRNLRPATQLAAFLAHADEDRLGPGFRVLAFTGLRRGELCGLRWSDLDLE